MFEKLWKRFDSLFDDMGKEIDEEMKKFDIIDKEFDSIKDGDEGVTITREQRPDGTVVTTKKIVRKVVR